MAVYCMCFAWHCAKDCMEQDERSVKKMANREEYIEILSKAVKTVKEFNEDTPIKISLECVEDILELLQEQQEEIENLKQTLQSMMEGVCLLKEQKGIVCVDEIDEELYNSLPKEGTIELGS